MTAHRDGEGIWWMRPARPAEGGTGYTVFRDVYRAEAGCFVTDLSTVEAHPDYRSALAAVIERRREGN